MNPAKYQEMAPTKSVQGPLWPLLYLASHHDRRPALRYFESRINVQQKKQKPKTNKKMGKEKQPKQEVDKVKKVLVEELWQCHF